MFIDCDSSLKPSSPRCAAYFAPAADHPLWRAGCEWLGRDPASETSSPPARPGVREPWRYGFHATLKAPMHLVTGADASGFIEDLERLAADAVRFEMPTLEIAWMDGFLALTPRTPPSPDHPLNRLARACVTGLDRWRAAPSAAESARRDVDRLDARQRELLSRYGYPHVLDRWRFHFTLSDTFGAQAAQRAELEGAARAHFSAALVEPLVCDSISLFVEPAAGAPFRLTRRFKLAG